MKLNEHMSKSLFHEANLPVPPGILLRPDQTVQIPFDPPWILKAQVLSGGRGKAGGIQIAQSSDQATEKLEQIFGLCIAQERVQLVRVEPQALFTREIYLSISLNRAKSCFSVTVGRVGGVEIETQAADTILVEQVQADQNLASYQIRNLFYHLDLPPALLKPFAALLGTLYKITTRHRLLLAEINPLVVSASGNFLILDGKVEIDDHQIGIDPGLNRFFEPIHLAPEENRSRAAGLSFHKLGGFIGLMVNGAGLAMATMDSLNYAGLETANFLDLGGGADQDAMQVAFDILFEDQKVCAVFINIFGGILSCAQVAQAMLEALNNQAPRKPVVVRFAGNSAAQGLEILRQAGLKRLHICQDVPEAQGLLAQYARGREPSRQYSCLQISSPPARPARPRTQSTAFPLADDCHVLVQGITGKQGQLHCRLMQAYGTRVVAGVTPGKGGQEICGVPVFNTVREAARHQRIDASVIFVPGALAPDAVLEAAAAGIGWVVCITDGIPQQDMLQALTRLRDSRTRVIGPNCPGLVVPGQTKIGIMPNDIFLPGPVAVFSRSGTLTYECVAQLTKAKIGQSVCVGVGGDPFIGTNFTTLCQLVRHDPRTKAVVILGEIGGTAEEELGTYLKTSGFELPVFGFIAGQTAPPGKRLGHAGAILEKGSSGIEGKLKAMADSGFHLLSSLDQVAAAVGAIL